MNSEVLQGIQNEIRTLNEFYDFLKARTQECILDVVQEFCDERDLPLEELGLLISQDDSLKQYTEMNLKKFKFIQPPKTKKTEIW